MAHSLIYGFWFGGMALQALLAAILLSKRVGGKFALFTAYCLVNFLETVVLYLVHHHLHLYTYTYWLFESLGTILGLGVAYEIFAHLFSLHPALRILATRVFRWTIVVLVFLGCLLIYKESPIRASSVTNAILVVEQAARIVEVGLVIFLFVSASIFGLHWRQSAFGIVLGVGLFATTELVVVTMFSQFDPAGRQILNLIRMAAFDSSLLIWIGYILAPERVTVGELPKREQLEQWNQAVMELIGQ